MIAQEILDGGFRGWPFGSRDSIASGSLDAGDIILVRHMDFDSATLIASLRIVNVLGPERAAAAAVQCGWIEAGDRMLAEGA